MTRARSLAAFAVVAALALSACGSSSSDGGAAATTTAPSGSKAPVALAGKVNDEGTQDLSAKGSTASLHMELDDDYFKPTFVRAAPGATVTIELENEGAMAHTFTLDDGSVDQQVAPGKKAEVTVTIPADGSLRFSCNFHAKAGMQGAFYTAPSGSPGSSGRTATTTASSDQPGY